MSLFCILLHILTLFSQQALVGARKKEIETEEHLLKIVEREKGRLGQEIKRISSEMEDLKEKRNIYEVFVKCIYNFQGFSVY